MQFLNENAVQYNNTDMIVWLLTAMSGLLAPKIQFREPDLYNGDNSYVSIQVVSFLQLMKTWNNMLAPAPV